MTDGFFSVTDIVLNGVGEPCNGRPVSFHDDKDDDDDDDDDDKIFPVSGLFEDPWPLYCPRTRRLRC